MSKSNSPAGSAVKLYAQVTCPHCWERFTPDQVLFIAEHEALYGDPLLGREQMQRFPPSRFTPEGEALDAKGLRCTRMACPKCHLPIPSGLLELEPLFLSILGSSSSGKSYFLAALTWELRRSLPGDFAINFADADMTTNRPLNQREEALFLAPPADVPIPLGNLIDKTQLTGEDGYDKVTYGQQSITYPRPFLFAMHPKPNHPSRTAAERPGHMICLYDNAGESFEPGKDTTTSPVTRHMALSRALLFLFDPTQDNRFRRLCQTRSITLPPPAPGVQPSRQELILLEAAERVRRYAKLRQNEKHERPLIVILTKFDEWSKLLDPQDMTPPWKTAKATGVSAFDLDSYQRQSQKLHEMMKSFCPELVAAAEGLTRDVTYVAISAVGWKSVTDPESGRRCIRPQDLSPHGVTVPLLYVLSTCTKGLIPKIVRKQFLAEG